ncbi:MAG: hypothetical protein O2944_08610 [Proteobacteria bacterium]|nr:hypothetical protein [Pseudomonadota bacterium]
MLEHPTTTKDVYRLAQVLLERHGEGAVIFAAKVAEELRDQGDDEGHAAWKRVVKAVIDLIDDEPPEDAVH